MSDTPCTPTKPFSPPLLSTVTHLFLLFGHSLPDLACLLRKICDADARMVWLDLLSAGIKPQHVCRHRPLRGIWIFTLLRLHEKETKCHQPSIFLNYPKFPQGNHLGRGKMQGELDGTGYPGTALRAGLAAFSFSKRCPGQRQDVS